METYMLISYIWALASVVGFVVYLIFFLDTTEESPVDALLDEKEE